MTKDEQYAEAKAKILDKVSSWSDMYELFDELVGRVLGTGANVYETMFMLYAFIHALRDLPDEGDIKAICERMIRVLIYEGKEKLGAEMTIFSEKEALEHIKARARELAAAVAMADDSDTDVRVLH